MQATRLKVIISAAILIAGLAVTVLALSSVSFTPTSGVVVDFGDRETFYEGVDPESAPDPLSAIEYACDVRGMELSVEGGTVTGVGTVANEGDMAWRLFAVERDSSGWTELKGDPSSYTIEDYVVVCWGFCPEGGEPSPAIDATGVCFYGYPLPNRVISIAPSSTETVCAAGGMNSIVATDMYSNYPQQIVDGHDNGTIAEVGGFTNPSYEMVLKNDPDLVVCISSQNSHIQLAEKLRSNGINVLVMDGGEGVEVVMNNMFMAGVVLGTQEDTNENIDRAAGDIATIGGMVDSAENVWDKRVMVSLSAVKSPWVSGSGTYIHDVMSNIGVDNIYSNESGWVQVNSETIIKNDPEYIIVVSSDYSATQEDYDSMMASLSSEWRGTTAYSSGNIYLFCEEACDLVSRAGPRVAQITELFARTLQDAAFDDGITIPKFLGDNYRDYLTFTKEGYI